MSRQADPELILAAREMTRRLYGQSLESKASDEFCTHLYAKRTGLVRAMVEGGVRSAAFAPDEPTPSVIEFGADSSLPTDAGDPPSAAARLHATRTAGYHAVAEIYDEIERQSGMAMLESLSLSRRAPTVVTQVCWLNRTMRTWADPIVVADICADPKVTAIDVARPLVAESDINGHGAMGLTAAVRKKFGSGKDVTVAVIDTEVALRHPALSGRVIHRRNYTDEPWGNPNAHGTAVAGIIASNDTQVPGIAPEATIYNYKVLATNSRLNGDNFGGTLAIQQALEDGAAIANCSWGAGPVGPAKSREAVAVDTAWALGMIVVKSAGNQGPGRGTMTTPADADGVIVVGATDLAGKSVQSYSSRGPAAQRPGPDCVAPGGTYESDEDHLTAALVAGGFGDAGAGTSYAAPCVSGLAALLVANDPNVSPDQVRDHIVATAKKIPRVAVSAQGAGLVQMVPRKAGS